MKRNVIAILLSISLIAGSFGAVPSYAAEVTAQEEITENEQGGASVPSEDELSASGEEEAAPDVSSQSAEGQSVENEPVGGEEQIISNEIEESGNGTTQELDENEIAEEGLSDEEAIGEEAGSAATDVDTEIAAVVEPTVESTKGKEAALEGETGDIVASGSCGDNATWTLTGAENDLTLTISGSGEMADYADVDYQPWSINKSNITHIIINEGISTIGKYAFAASNNLVYLEMADSVTRINVRAFSGCSKLSELSLPANLQVLELYVFENCTGLKSIYLPQKKIDCDAPFYGCSNVTEITIPLALLKSNALSGLHNLKKVTFYGDGEMPEIDSFGYSCLGKDKNTSKSIEEIVFDCNFTRFLNVWNVRDGGKFENLRTITLPSTVTETDYYPSSFIEGQTTVIGYGYTFAEYWADRVKLQFSPIDIKEPSGVLDNGVEWRLDKNRTLTISGQGKVETCTPWEQYLPFTERIVVEEGITSISHIAEYTAKQIPVSSVQLPDSLNEIGEFSFFNCSFETIDIPSSVSRIGKRAFVKCLLKEINFPENLTEIGEYAFSYCEELKSLDIPSSCTTIGRGAFSGCSNVEFIRVINTAITWGSLGGLTGLKTIDIFGEGGLPNFTNSGGVEVSIYSSADTLETIILEEGITNIQTSIFSTCHNIKHVVLPSTINSRCGDLIKSEHLKSIGPIGSGSNVEYAWNDTIPNSAFSGCTSIQSVTVSDGINKLGSWSFAGTNSLETITIPESITEIGKYAFRNSGISNITIPKSTKTIGEGAFNGCENLKSAGPIGSGCDLEYGWTGKIIDKAFCESSIESATITDSIKIIGSNAFGNCSLKSITIPSSINTIGENAFNNCQDLRIVFKGDIPAINNSAFNSANCTAYYPYGNETYTSSTMVGYGGTITWKADPETTGTLTKLELIKEPAKKLYVTGEELSLEGLRIKAYYDSGYDEIIDSTEITVGEHDLSTPGNKQIEIWYKDKSISFDVNVCTLVDKSVDSSLYPESTHDYENNLNEEYSFIYEDAQRLSVTFSAATQVEDDIDFIYIYDANGTLLNTYTGTSAAGQTIDINGNSFVIKLVSDDSGTAYGFSIDSITALAYGHVWHETVFKEPTCTEEGLKGLECQECGYRRSEITPALGHTYEDTVVEPACTTDGYTSHVCTRCGDSYIDNEIDAPGHTFSEWVVDQDSTCTEEGTKHRECSVCEYIETEIIDKNEHAFSSDYIVDVEPTCTESGEKSIYCENCGEKKEDSTVEIPALEHLYGEAVIEPTCTTGGYTIHICGRCNDSYKDYETEPKGHTFTNWIIDHDSTCTEEGIQHRECADCGYIETRGINKKEHSFDTEFTVDKEPTCTTDGSRSYHCTSEGCTATTGSEVIPATGHDYSDWTVTREATCTENGEMERTCEVCDETETVEFGARGHVWLKVYTVDQEATCTEEGSESIHCAECDAINEATVRAIPKKEHAFGDWTVTKEATCTEAGSREKVCADCGETDTVEIPALGHLYGEVVIEPTCTTGGHTTHVCARCGDSYIDHETNPTGHSFGDWIVDHDSTCTDEGIQHRECEDCGYTETKGINKKQHSFDTEYTVDKEPTCTADGSKSYHCTTEGCTATTGSEVIPATGHNYGDWTVTREATCTESGEMERTCAVCDETETVEFGARGHVWLKTPTVDQEATCTEEGSESIRCAVCDEIKEGSVQAIPPKGHRLIHFEAVEPTYESDGNIEYFRCEQCDHMYGDQNCDNEISAGDIVIPALEWISVSQISLNKSEITINRYVKEQFEVTVSPENATNKRVNWASSDENVAIVDENGAVTGNGFGDAVITATAEDGGISAQCTVHVVSRVKIVTQPANKAAESGETVAFTVEAEGNELSYQWQWSADGTTWKNCASTSYNTATFTFVMKEKYAGRQYRCIVSGEGEIVTSDAALLSLKEEEKYKVQPADAEAADGEMASFHVEFEGDSPTYRWQWSADGTVWKNCTGSGYNTDTFSFVMKEKYAGRKYRCVVKDGTETYTSNVATLKLGKSLKITLQPEDATVSAGQSALFHVEAEGSSLSYQWQVSSTGTTWKNCTGVGYNTDTFSFTTKSTFSGRKYRCKISDGTNTIISDSAELTVTE